MMPSGFLYAWLRFADGALRAATSAQATGQVTRAAVTLPADVREQITRRRKPGDPSAAIDPMDDDALHAAADALAEARERELSRMFAGMEDSDTALAHARELLDSAAPGRALA